MQQQQQPKTLYMSLCQNNLTNKRLLTVSRGKGYEGDTWNDSKVGVIQSELNCQYLTDVRPCNNSYSLNRFNHMFYEVTANLQNDQSQCQLMDELLKCYRPTVLQVEANLHRSGDEKFYLSQCKDEQLAAYPKITVLFTGTKMDESEQNDLDRKFAKAGKRMYVVDHTKRKQFNDPIRKILANPNRIQARATQGDNDVPE